MTTTTMALNAVIGYVQFMPLVFLSFLAFWRMHPVLFMFNGGIAMITAFYIPDIINSGVTDNLGIAVALGMMGYSLVCFAFAFKLMFSVNKG